MAVNNNARLALSRRLRWILAAVGVFARQRGLSPRRSVRPIRSTPVSGGSKGSRPGHYGCNSGFTACAKYQN